MPEYTSVEVNALIQEETKSSLEEMLREGARQMLQMALEMEVSTYLDGYTDQRDAVGHQAVVRNGYHQARSLVTGVGPIPIRQPRVHHRGTDQSFTSAILPPYLRRTPSIDALIPALYLKGVSTSQFPDALSAILREGVSGLSSANIVRLKAVWEEEYLKWQKRDLRGKHYVYIWADGIYFK
jgi:transposase-like protein